MEVRRRVVEVFTPFEQIQLFCKFAEHYATDYFSDDLAWLRQKNLREFFYLVRSKYLREKGEQILRPLFYWRAGGDCDDAAINYMAAFIAGGESPENILVVEAKEPGADHYCHIFTALLVDQADGSQYIIWLDNLPHSEFDRLDYSSENVRITRMSNYL